MRFVIVNFVREGPADDCCACCMHLLTRGYLRELSTGILYCTDVECLHQHTFMAMHAIEYKAREVT